MSTLEIGLRLRRARTEQGLSLSELARRSGVGKGSLSEIETGKRNPTVDTLYALCRPLGIPLSALLGGTAGSESVAPGGMRTILISVRELSDATVEVFRLEFPASADHVSPAHGPGVTEHITVVAGALEVGPDGAGSTVVAGESTSWASDRPHRYTAVDGPGEAVLVIRSPRGARPA